MTSEEKRVHAHRVVLLGMRALARDAERQRRADERAAMAQIGGDHEDD